MIDDPQQDTENGGNNCDDGNDFAKSHALLGRLRRCRFRSREESDLLLGGVLKVMHLFDLKGIECLFRDSEQVPATIKNDVVEWGVTLPSANLDE
jgi:hypothetical protein